MLVKHMISLGAITGLDLLSSTPVTRRPAEFDLAMTCDRDRSSEIRDHGLQKALALHRRILASALSLSLLLRFETQDRPTSSAICLSCSLGMMLLVATVVPL